MRFIIRPGTDPVARADSALLAAMGLPGGGIVALGSTHCLVSPGDVPGPNALTVGPLARENAGVSIGDSLDVVRAVVPQARRVVILGGEPLDSRHLARALQGNVVTVGDQIAVRGSYGDQGEEERVVRVVSVEPGPSGTVGDRTVVHDSEDDGPGRIRTADGAPARRDALHRRRLVDRPRYRTRDPRRMDHASDLPFRPAWFVGTSLRSQASSWRDRPDAVVQNWSRQQPRPPA